MENISVYLRIKPSSSNNNNQSYLINSDDNSQLHNLKTNELYSFGKNIFNPI
jgi:hypothetical protein